MFYIYIYLYFIIAEELFNCCLKELIREKTEKARTCCKFLSFVLRINENLKIHVCIIFVNDNGYTIKKGR